MAEPILDRPGIVAGVCQRIAAPVAQHVRMHQEVEAGALPDALDQPVRGIRREWSAALGREDEAAVRELPPRLPHALISSPRSGRTDGLPFFYLRTCSAADRPNSIWDHPRSQISEARRPCRKAIRIKVASR
jgi:hypothetical protein